MKKGYTVCYVGSCMHNDHNRCKKGIPAGQCDRRAKYMSQEGRQYGR